MQLCILSIVFTYFKIFSLINYNHWNLSTPKYWNKYLVIKIIIFVDFLLICSLGESIAITADFENLSSRTIIPHATLHQTQTFLAGGKSRTRHSKYTIVTGLAIQPGRTTSWDAQLLKIPAVTPSIINCCLIRVDYAIRVSWDIWQIFYRGVISLSIYYYFFYFILLR